MTVENRAYVREWRLAKGLTQPELAKRVGSVKSEISRLENGSRRLTLDWMSSLARAMGISVEDLMTIPPMGFGAVSPAPTLKSKTPTPDGFEVEEFSGTAIGVKETHGLVTIAGDDWIGTFSPGDLLIFDRSKTSAAIPGIYVLRVEGELMVRRVNPGTDGAQLSCSNPEYPVTTMSNAHQVLGRIIGRIHRV